MGIWGARRLAQPIKCSLWKSEDLRSNPGTTQKAGRFCAFIIPVLQSRETSFPRAHWSYCLAKSAGWRSSEVPIKKRKENGKQLRETLDVNPRLHIFATALPHIYVNAQMNIYVHTQDNRWEPRVRHRGTAKASLPLFLSHLCSASFFQRHHS